MSSEPARTALERLRSANVSTDQIYWFDRLADRDALNRLPGRAILLPGECAVVTDTLVDLATGDLVCDVERVPPGAVYGRLDMIEPYLRRRASELYLGEAGSSGRGVVTRSTPEQEAELTGEP